MQASHINCFIAAVRNVFQIMVNTDVTVDQPHVKTDPHPTHDVTGIITLSGDVAGAVALSMPAETAVNVVEVFSGRRYPIGADEFSDAIGELANMVSGNAKKDLNNMGVSISIPTVVIGANHRLGRHQLGPWIELECHSALGAFDLGVCMVNTRVAVSAGGVR